MDDVVTTRTVLSKVTRNATCILVLPVRNSFSTPNPRGEFVWQLCMVRETGVEFFECSALPIVLNSQNCLPVTYGELQRIHSVTIGLCEVCEVDTVNKGGVRSSDALIWIR